MRRDFFIVLWLTAITSTLSTGCHQTAGTAATGPLIPLSPNNSASAPSLLPFNGTTRVTPPPTGSYSVPNNYMGGVAPSGQSSNAFPTTGGFAATGGFAPAPSGFAPAPPSQVIGSGVRPAGWTETNSNLAAVNPNATGLVPFNGGTNLGVNPLPARDPRSGGMQVIDLTGSAPPPGYQPQFAPAPSFNSQQNFDAQQYFQSQQILNQPQQFAPLQSIQAPTAREYANAVAPGPSSVIAQAREYPLNSSGSVTPLSSRAINSGLPSTEPIGNGVSQQDNLPWRRPGTQY